MTEFSPQGSVERVGDTVRRPARPFSASVQAVLRHLRDAGLTGVPEPLGFDDEGREVVSFLAGDVWNDPIPELVWHEQTLTAAARLLRRMHDATAAFEPPDDARWRYGASRSCGGSRSSAPPEPRPATRACGVSTPASTRPTSPI